MDHSKPKLRYLYVGPLDKIIEAYIESGVLGSTP
ncbi:putative integrase [Acidianus hospitalis]